ncbi:CHAT domain-containing protein [Tenacibaculum skagerrakense]|uniref:CHAT domain-containing protein n=1 Tax=Tenacibaculum skagerrakense TaxID=186571 RepID=A0A4R2NQV5_9FLAO|nr:CHAT domain-containing protein [Tenacibaculum skagerrakense]TCP24220.1 CHAT domain-containing protein [Tenacibaculum skagerrakense]
MRIFQALFFCSFLCISAQKLEGKIYTTLDDFLANPTEAVLQQLLEKEKSFEVEVSSREEQLALVILQCNTAYFLKEKSLFQKAITYYEKAWARFNKKELSNYDIIEYCLKPLGNLYTQTNNYANAERIIKLYISIAEEKQSLIQKVAGIINLCLLYQSIGKHETVVTIIDETLQLYEVNGKQQQRLNVIKNNSYVLLRNWKEDVNSDYLNYKKKLVNGNYKEAYVSFEKAKSERFKDVQSIREKVKWWLEEAQLLLLLEKEKNANQILNLALQGLLPDYKEPIDVSGLYPESLLIDIFDMKAQLANNIESSLGFYDMSFYVEDLMKQQTTTQQTQLLYEVNSRKRSEKCIELALKNHSETQNKNMIERAFQYTNKGKSSVLLRKRNIRELRRKNTTDSLLIKEELLQQQKEKLITKFSKVNYHLQSKDSIEKYNLLFSEIDKELIILNKKLCDKYPFLASDNVDLSEIKRMANNLESVFVVYFFGNNRIHQFIVDESELKVNSIEITTELREDIINYIQLFDTPKNIVNNVKNYTTLSFKLYKSLKFDELASYDNVGIVTDGLLNFIPFETLLTEKTESIFFQKMPFVIKQQNIVYNFTTQMFSASKPREKDNYVTGFFPIFKNTSKELQFSENEAEAIKANFTSNIFKNEEANKINFIREVGENSIIHLSTHAENKGISSEAFIDFYDQKLYQNELYSLNCKANLVVLSACETGVGGLVKGEGSMSLARGFSYAGAENILFTLWQVNDKSSSEIVRNFYASLKSKADISKANHQSKIKYLTNPTIENAYKSPYYWGAFVYYGSIQPKEDSNQLLFMIFSLLLLFIIFLRLRKQIKL